jgi:hypothetical protein
VKPLCVDLYCGLGGWADGFLAEGYRVIGFDIEAHDYGTGGYPGELILRDVRSICGGEFRDAAVIVASPPCQEPSYRAMPWKRAKALNEVGPPVNFIALFNECFRIQREASEAAGRYIPLIVENVRGAQRWVGRAQANFGSYYLWGDVGMVGKRVVVGSLRFGMSVAPTKAQKFNPDGTEHGLGSWFAIANSKERGASAKIPGFRFDGESHGSFQSAAVKIVGYSAPRRNGGKGAHLTSQQENDLRRGVKGFTPNGEPLGKNTLGRKHGSKSTARKAASAMIAKIPFPLAQYIAQAFKPTENARSLDCARDDRVLAEVVHG